MRDSIRGNLAQKGDAAASSSFLTNTKQTSTGIIGILLVAMIWIVFGQTLRHDFINYDDDQYVYANPRIKNGLSLDGIQWAFTHVHAHNWHPVTTISHMLDCQLYDLQPWGHHLTNVLLHTAAAILLFVALWQLTGSRWPSAFVASVFAVHPLHVSSVAWVAERKDVLSGVFFMLTLWAYGRYVRQPSWRRYTTAIVFFATGLMSKPTLVTLPFVLLLLDYWPLRRFGGAGPIRGELIPARTICYLAIEKIPFFLLSVGSCAATLLAQGESVAAISRLTVGERVGNAIVSYVVYLYQMIWPVGLAVVYPYPAHGLNIAQILLALLVLLIVTTVFFVSRRKRPFLLMGWLWFLGVLVPMIGIVQVGDQARADRYAYLAEIGLYVLLTWGAMELFSKWRHGREVLIALAVLIITGLMADSYVQGAHWQNSERLWNQALANSHDNYAAHNNLGNALKEKGQLGNAIVQYRKALEICTNCPEIYNNLGNTLAAMGDWPQAITSYRAALRDWPKPDAHNNNNLGIALAQVGQTNEALAQFREAVRLDQDFSDAHYNLAMLLRQLGQPREAEIHLKEVLRLKPDDEQVKEQLRQLGVEKTSGISKSDGEP